MVATHAELMAPRGCAHMRCAHMRARRAPAHWWCTRGVVEELVGKNTNSKTEAVRSRGRGARAPRDCDDKVVCGSEKERKEVLSFAPIYFVSEYDFDNIYGINMVQCGVIRRTSPQLRHKIFAKQKNHPPKRST